ncbi:hypothetical protein Vau01_125430 [Virgisporangium aurantiacum]|uniref:Uncharacterized protein n=1 Tax=Virgisporangium aurantiacum TaxID=175570 RepID=A0A8J3ZJ32_9ACTN|nr:hypothetical protein Vau01_125430 [Virgisporangium aurantiacum]
MRLRSVGRPPDHTTFPTGSTILSPSDTIRTLTSWLVNATEPSTPTRPVTPSDATAPTDPAERADDAPPTHALLVLHDGEAIDAPPGTHCHVRRRGRDTRA